ncbi:hypothetical protein L484_001703 [Morus notabilis]|uniref:Uncharacterized protein n=1 Tax=Morus notabilis TaxID=981085 RepID=W9QW29_9ROSA|nr:hypothetical protein L484_001703 [Morus notabilis]
MGHSLTDYGWSPEKPLEDRRKNRQTVAGKDVGGFLKSLSESRRRVVEKLVRKAAKGFPKKLPEVAENAVERLPKKQLDRCT